MSISGLRDFRQFVEMHLGPPAKGYGQGKWWVWHCQVNRPDREPSLKVEADGFKCFSCGGYGTGRFAPARFLHLEMGWAWDLALQELDAPERPRYDEGPVIRVGPVPPVVEWRDTVGGLCNQAVAQWGGGQEWAADYLRRRGFDRETWLHFGLGCNRDWVRIEQFDTWLAPGIVIPCRVDGLLWSVEVRLLGHQDLRYHRPKGGSEPVPYGFEYFQDREVLIVTEGAFDVMACWQVAGDEVDALALRGAANQLVTWQDRLVHRRVLVATDADRAGDEAAVRLISCHPTWQRLRPFGGKDLAGMLELGLLSREWLLAGEVKL